MYINEGSASYISKQLIVRSSVSVSKTVTTLSALSSIEKFYWNFIALCCCRIHVGVKDLQKLSRFAFAIENLSSIYSAYCNKRSNVSQPLCEVPEEIKHTDVREYFKWIIMMQRVLIYWQELFAEQAYNYEDILLYTEALPTIDKLAKSLNITHLVYEIDQIKVLKAHYYEHYAKCCSLMVKRSNDVDGYVFDVMYAYISVVFLKQLHKVANQLNYSNSRRIKRLSTCGLTMQVLALIMFLFKKINHRL